MTQDSTDVAHICGASGALTAGVLLCAFFFLISRTPCNCFDRTQNLFTYIICISNINIWCIHNEYSLTTLCAIAVPFPFRPHTKHVRIIYSKVIQSTRWTFEYEIMYLLNSLRDFAYIFAEKKLTCNIVDTFIYHTTWTLSVNLAFFSSTQAIHGYTHESSL